MDIAQTLSFVFRVLLPPALLLGITAWAWRLSQEGRDERRRYGFWLGVSVAILVIVIELFMQPVAVISFADVRPFTLTTSTILGNVVLGVILGLAAMGANRLLAKTAAVPILIAALTSASLISLYQYTVSGIARDQVLLIALSFVVGAVGFAVFAGASD